MELNSCRGFRNELVAVLAGRTRPDDLRHLSWHEHLLGCGSCRDLFEREEALELLLATLPDPQLPPDLTRRLVFLLGADEEASSETRGLQALGLDSLLELDGAQVPDGLAGRICRGIADEQALDQLLDQWPAIEVPEGLASRVCVGLEHKADSALDALLDLNQVAPAPAGLSQRVLLGLAADRERAVPRLRLLKRLPRFAGAAALLLAVLSAPMWIEESPTVINEDIASAQPASVPDVDDVDPSLLAMLDVLENDELWADSDADSQIVRDEDFHLLLEDEIDLEDEMLLAFLSEEDLEGTDLGAK